MKYNRPGGKVSLNISTPAADRLRVTVEDTGVGIPLAKQSLLFQPFSASVRNPDRSKEPALAW